jgi:hypothetical protein
MDCCGLDGELEGQGVEIVELLFWHTEELWDVYESVRQRSQMSICIEGIFFGQCW